MAAPGSTLTFLRPEDLARIRNLHLAARLIVEGMHAGIHRSPYHGFSAEFSEFRPYHPGESARLIDWRKYAKSDATVVRLFEDETNLFAHLLLDTSASMRFCSGRHPAKFEYARLLCASLAWLLLRQRDAVGFAAFDERLRHYVAPRSAGVQLRAIIGRVDAAEPSGATSCAAAIEGLAVHLRRRGMTVLVSDLLDDAAAVERGLRHLRFKRQDVLLLWVRDPLERRFQGDGGLRLRDLESGETMSLDAAVAGRFWNEGMQEHCRAIEAMCRDLRVDLVHVFTDEPFQKVLSEVLRKRQRLF